MASNKNNRPPLSVTLVRHEVLGAAFSALVDDTAALVAAGFTDPQTLIEETRRRLGVGSITACHDQDHPVRRALTTYENGHLAAIETLAVAAARTEFTAAVIRAMRAIIPGQPITYTELATSAGRPRAAQAAANVCATNPVALIVPCHRVVRRGAARDGHAPGTGIKQMLLDHERRHASA